MNLYRKYRVKILEIFNIFIFLNNYKISYYFSRLGNNLQQIAIGILYTKTNSVSAESSVPYHFQLSYITTLDNKTFATGLCPARNGCLQNGQSPSIFSHELNEAYDDTLHIVAIINKIVMHFGNLIVVIVSQSILLSTYNMYCVKSL